MATIKAIEAKSVHQIQSGQVIVDLCSVVKELVENSLDAEATSIEVRFKNNGLDSIEVQDNGAGIAPANYDSLALKHHTSKLSSYADLSNLRTFGFRGEALSSLCALSSFHIITAQVDEAPKGKRLDFDLSGRLTSTSVVACQRGTTACVENLFEQLPVRRKELAKNIKREYGKVIGLLHAYACICTNVKLSVKSSMSKGKSATVFATKANETTRENIANVYGAKTLSALLAFDLDLDLNPTPAQMGRNEAHSTSIILRGHISKPVVGEGRQTPDRQMFFVNGRPCGLPQVAKAINEVYKGFNVSQSPFVFADFEMDTNAYDVNVSPDKRTILLHNSAALIERLKAALTDLFEKQDQTVPQSYAQSVRLPSFKQLNIQLQESVDAPGSAGSRRTSRTSNTGRLQDEDNNFDPSSPDEEGELSSVLRDHFRNKASTREEPVAKDKEINEEKIQRDRERRAEKTAHALAEQGKAKEGFGENDEMQEVQSVAGDSAGEEPEETVQNIRVRDFNKRLAEKQNASELASDTDNDKNRDGEALYSMTSQNFQKEKTNVVQKAFDHMRPRRSQAEIATITIGDKTITTVVGTQIPRRPADVEVYHNDAQSKRASKKTAESLATQQFSQGLRKFGATRTHVEDVSYPDDDDEGEESDNAETEGDDEEDNLEEIEDGGLDNESRAGLESRSQGLSENSNSDSEYIDEAEKKAAEEAKVAELIKAAEESAVIPSKENLKRANKALKRGVSKDSTTTLLTDARIDLQSLEDHASLVGQLTPQTDTNEFGIDKFQKVQSEEEKLSLTVSKDDFPNMHIIGQFNLGFILAVRPGSHSPLRLVADHNVHKSDELFIIDQHASDEKYNFERLQAETVVGNQRLVVPVLLDLTAVEEEVVFENLPALERNGFILEVDTTGKQPVGQRCRLLSLPLSREVTFDTRDLEELLHLLGEWPSLSPDSVSIPRPTKVRKMFAMRACRSSIMIGKTLSKRQMKGVLEHMGRIDKPWNCPHGRPTMRHLITLSALGGWREGDGVTGLEQDDTDDMENEADVWKRYTT